MPAAIDWSPTADAAIIRMRSERASWDQIALAIGANRETARRRGNRLGDVLPTPDIEATMDLSRDPLPAGHPATWDHINTGTCLEGLAWPRP